VVFFAGLVGDGAQCGVSHSAASQGGGYAALQVLGTAPAAGVRLQARAAAALGRASLLRVWAVRAEAVAGAGVGIGRGGDRAIEGGKSSEAAGEVSNGTAAMEGEGYEGEGGEDGQGDEWGHSQSQQSWGYGGGEYDDSTEQTGAWEGAVAEEAPPSMQRMPVAGSFLWRRAGCVAWCKSVFAAVRSSAPGSPAGDSTIRLLAGAARALEGCVAGACVSVERREARAGLDPAVLLAEAEGADAATATAETARARIWVACVARRAASLGGEFSAALSGGLEACSALLLRRESVGSSGEATEAAAEAAKKPVPGAAKVLACLLSLLQLHEGLLEWVGCSESVGRTAESFSRESVLQGRAAVVKSGVS